MSEKPMWTPGPWEVRRAKYPVDGEFDYAIGAEIDDAQYCIAEAFGRAAEYQYLPAEANAHLIAAAPEMYEALERWLRLATNPQISSETYWREWPSIRDAADAALAKARGETS